MTVMLRHYSALSRNASTQRFFTVPKFPFSWPSIPLRLPHRLRRKLRSTRSKIRSMQSPTSSIASLNISLDPSDTIRALRTHQWSYYDAQYLFLAILGIFCLSVMESPGPLVKTLLATLFMTSLVIPLTRQFILPGLPVFGWFIFFYSCQFISGEYRPPIWVRTLPALENILYGANLSNILSAHKNTVLDVLAWLPYGFMHYGSPVVTALLLFLFGPPGSMPVFAKSFGYMDITAVMIQLLFPCAPPWYENTYGLAPANYSMHGSPAGLAAIDKLFNIDFYTPAFTASPMVFGAFPSLHAGWATMNALFLSHTFPKLRPLFIFYVMWLWWSTMYLSHHYAVDLVAGSIIAFSIFFFARSKFLPRLQPGKMFRWDYDYVERGEEVRESDVYGLTEFDDYHPDSDKWATSSSSSFSTSSRDHSAGTRSPLTENSWEGDTLASSSDNEYQKA